MQCLARRQTLDRELSEQGQTERLWRTRQHAIGALLPAQPPSPESVAIRVRLPTGTVIQRSFLASDSVKLLFYFIFCSADCPRDFSVFSVCPRQEVLCRPQHPEWDSAVLCRLPRPEFADPPDFRCAALPTNITLYVVDNDA